MDEPDIQLDALSIWVRGREFPEATNSWDENWLTLRAQLRTAQSSVTVEGPILMNTDFERFRDQLAAMYKSLQGEALLSGYEPNLKVTLTAGSLGHIGGEVEITPDHLSEHHRYDIGIGDQTFLPPLIAACDGIIQRYPVLNRL